MEGAGMESFRRVVRRQSGAVERGHYGCGLGNILFVWENLTRRNKDSVVMSSV